METIGSDRVGTYRAVSFIGSTAGGVTVEIDLEDYKTFALYCPASTASVTVIPKVAEATGGTFLAVADDEGNDYTWTVAASRVIAIDADAMGLAAARFLKLTFNADDSARTYYMLMKR